ncbi:arachidonate 8S-lipoxygenase-like [Poecilia formosa]|uniref:arachidonate 8S-lipoxygenase-like n=1 Tax=Poecilia formosa TaxID=48698 RepID=UPI0007B9F0D1|nr:PREDICTED: arachidonate 8S-lipoxygenase-like [Poecilia formosa]
MTTYIVTVSTGDETHTSKFHSAFITLGGKEGWSDRTKLTSLRPPFLQGNVLTFEMACNRPLGELLAIILEKQGDPWFVAKLEVKSPLGDLYHFPVHKWITDCNKHYIQEGSDLEEKQALYRWNQFKDGLPFSMKADSSTSLPLDEHFYYKKDLDMIFTGAKAISMLKLRQWAECKSKWTNIEDIYYLYRCHRTKTSDYVYEHWKDNSFFGYQFLNGVNPMMIRRCKTLPRNFPVTDDMVFKNQNQKLTKEMEKGNIFLCDYKILDGVKPNNIKGKDQYLVAPLVLLHKTSDDKLMPIAIQLKQSPGKDNPIFLPSDTEWDWLLAKTFVRNADFNVHELSSHLLRTHLLPEVFAVALLRNIPMMHPLHKLLMPHVRYTMMINVLARERLISDDGVFKKFTSSGGEGMFTILQRALTSVTYRSLCLPDDISDRGLELLPNFYYRDDGLDLWNIIYSFVKGTLQYYYNKDEMVQEDEAVQQWLCEINSKGFPNQKNTGIPESFKTVDELVKFVTMVIFTCSAQHSAVNSGQYDFIGWMPNTPVSLERPPPSRKGEATEETLLHTFPAMDTTVQGMATVWLLSQPSTDAEYLGNYPEQRFTEDVPLENIKVFKEQLEKLSLKICQRNEGLDLPYTYLDPKNVENSVSL